MKKVLLTMLLLAFVQVSFSQNYKIGKVSKAELEEKTHPSDPSADAAYLYKNRRTYFDYREGEGYVVVTEVHERIKIYTKDGYNWATKTISFYAPESGDTEKVSIKDAKTFALIDGKVKSYKLGKSDIFKEVKNKYWSKKKFTMPNITEGCILEWRYKITSPYKGIEDVVMQYSIPIKKYESSIEVPEYFRYSVKQIGYLPINVVSTKKNSSINFSNSSRVQKGGLYTETSYSKLDYNTNVAKIEKDNIPALIEEPYINDIDNYRSSIKYELATIKWPNSPAKHFAQSWEDVAKTIMKNSEFGGQLEKTGHLKDDITQLSETFTTNTEKIYGALEYVKSKIKWNDYKGKYTDNGLRKAYKEGIGNIADINLTLVAVLRELGINANPVLVSTRNNGVPTFPTLSGLNYVIVAVESPQGTVLLDASEKYSLPNVLPLRVLNWRGTIVRKDKSVGFVDLSSSMISAEESTLSYKISEDGLIEGMNRSKSKNYAALSYRNRYGSLKEDAIISEIEENNDDIEILNFRLSNIDDLSKPVVELYKFEKEEGAEIIGNKMYITPMLFETTDENPFKIETREYPIDFGTPWEEKINVTIEIPEGYSLESLPENVAKGMSEDLGSFIYSIKNQGNKIQIASLIKLNQGIISANYYQEIKEMFKQIVAKQTEKIVLIKK
ncbi:MAG: transglutaminase [Lutibacter sp.]|nr:MAG: transglutaminase [Lutibacter sp.]